jgi:glyoxylase-like metal-dependent hydrolase (beta-lactamase superfamily II)
MEIVQGVYQIRLPLAGATKSSDETQSIKANKEDLIEVIEQTIQQNSSVSHVNVYLIEGDQGNLLIDTGWNTPEAYSTLTDELKSYGFGIKDISEIVVTHVHSDHFGLTGKLKQISGAKVALSEIEARIIDSRYINIDGLLSQMCDFLHTNGVPQDKISQLSEASLPAKALVMPATPDVKLKSGKKVNMNPFEFKVFLTPGHSPGHICLYEANRKLLFAGDHILPEISPFIGLHPQSGTDPLGDYYHSLKDLMKLEVNLVFPGHGPAFSGLKQTIENLLEHHEQRASLVLSTIQEDMKTGYQIATEIPWKSDIKGATFQYLNSLNQRLAIMETLAHLEHMKKQNKVQAENKGGLNYYWAAA